MKHSRKLFLIILSISGIVFSDKTAETMSQEVNFDYVKSLKNNKNVLLIDVREPQELQETGTIPGSINIPLSLVENTLKNESDAEFRQKFNRDKPNLETPLVFTCRTGRRSLMALNIAKNLGYVNVKHYPGGWTEWAEKTKNSS